MSSLHGAALLLAAALLLGGCPRPVSRDDQAAPTRPAAPCPAEASAPPVLPFEAPEHSLPGFWLARSGPDRLLVPWARIEEHNLRMSRLGEADWPTGRWDIRELRFEPGRLRERLLARLQRLRQAAERGQRVLASGQSPAALLDELRGVLAAMEPADEIRVAQRSTALRCFPTEVGVYEKPWDLAFDQMQCAQLRYGEPVRVLARRGPYSYVWSSYADGWVRHEDLTPPLGAAEVKSYLEPPAFLVMQQDRVPIWGDAEGRHLLGAARFGLRLPLLENQVSRYLVQAPSPTGLVTGWLLPELDEPEPGSALVSARPRPQPASHPRVSVGYPPLTRRALLTRAFRLLDTPYGWGGTGDKRDCSGLMMDLFAAFGLELPRNTRHQALAGTRQLEVGGLSEEAKARIIEEEARRALILLYMPGHIMLYLGRDGAHLYALHLFSGYLTPCAGKGETMQRVNRTVVTSLELGRGGSRRAFIQRITRLILFDALGGGSQL